MDCIDHDWSSSTQGHCYGLISYFVFPRNRILPGIYMALCYLIIKSKEFKLTYSESSENCAIAELTKNSEPIVYKYTGLSDVVGNNVWNCATNRADAETVVTRVGSSTKPRADEAPRPQLLGWPLDSPVCRRVPSLGYPRNVRRLSVTRLQHVFYSNS